ncbi:TonB-dependent receptor [Labilibacter sediminis]|nr:TonB-dependent receptor [Labilibacter sediminis]
MIKFIWKFHLTLKSKFIQMKKGFKNTCLRRLVFLFGLFILYSTIVHAQGRKVEGTVNGEDGTPIKVGSIHIGGTTQGVLFYDGKFSFDLPKGVKYFNVLAEGYEDKKVVISSESFYEVTLSTPDLPMDRNVQGVVYDNLNEPVVGATVVIKGTNQGTITDYNGKFNLQLPGSSNEIIVSFIGFDKQEINVAGKNNIEVYLQSGFEDLDEVVVVGYGVQRKSDLTGSVASVKAEELTKVASVGVDQALQGRASGVQINATSGKPGAGIDVKVRGIGTIGNSNPLYVVDGVPVETIEFINPGDIESLEVLKDASSTAIYGSRGANGVVLITTKKGDKERSSITYEGYFGWQTPIDNLELADAETYAILRNEGRRADGLLPLPGMDDPTSLGKGTDWLDEGFRSAPMHNHNVRLAGGSEKITYNLSFNYFGQEGTLIESNFERISFRVNNTYKLNNWLDVGNNITYVNFDGQGVYQNEGGGARTFDFFTAPPTMPVKNEDGSWGYDPNDYEQKNPVALFHLNNPENSGAQFIGNVYAQAKIKEGLIFKTTYGQDYFKNVVTLFVPDYEINPVQRNEGNDLSEYISERKSWVWTNTLTYMFELGEKSKFNTMIGHEMQETESTNITQSVFNIPDGLKDSNFIGSGNPSSSSITGTRTESSLVSFFGRVNYNFDNRVLFTANFRADGSSRFGSSNRWGYFPSFALGWNLHQESFMQDQDWLSQLKFRAGWGQIGNQKIGEYAYLTSIKDNFKYYFGDQAINGKSPITVGNPDIKWETTTSTNAGVDLGLWNSKLTMNVDAFYKKTTDMLVNIPVPDYLGAWSNPFANAGEVENKGIELALGYHGRKNDFKYSITGNISFIKNKVLSLGEGAQPIISQKVSKTDVGQPIASFWGYKANGIFQSQQDVLNYTNSDDIVIQPDAKPGDVRYVDVNGDGKIDSKDQTWIGSPHPDFFFGLSSNLSYKKWDMSLLFQGSYGNDIYNLMAQTMIANAPSNMPVYYANERWVGAGTSNKYPRMSEVSSPDNKLNSSLWIEDGSYIRLKNVQLGYTVDPEKLESVGISSLRLYASVQNVFTLTNYKGMEPEQGRKEKSIGADYYNQNFTSFNIDRGTTPQPRTFIIGVNVSF